MITRKELIRLCENSIVKENKWHDRDSEKAQIQIGEAWALLKAGCMYREVSKNSHTLDIEVFSNGFRWFESGGEEDCKESRTFYIPTEERLKESKGGDWY